MGVQYELINIDKKEIISFSRLNTGNKARELSGTVVVGSIITRYMLNNIGDRITFIDDVCNNWKLFGLKISSKEIAQYKDMTDEVLQLLIEEEIYRRDGIQWIDEEDGTYDRLVTNIWDPRVNSSDQSGTL